MTINEMITDAQIDSVWGNANFGKDISRRSIVNETLLKYACGYVSGRTATSIAQELGLLTTKGKCKLTQKGAEYLYLACFLTLTNQDNG